MWVKSCHAAVCHVYYSCQLLIQHSANDLIGHMALSVLSVIGAGGRQFGSILPSIASVRWSHNTTGFLMLDPQVMRGSERTRDTTRTHRGGARASTSYHLQGEAKPPYQSVLASTRGYHSHREGRRILSDTTYRSAWWACRPERRDAGRQVGRRPGQKTK